MISQELGHFRPDVVADYLPRGSEFPKKEGMMPSFLTHSKYLLAVLALRNYRDGLQEQLLQPINLAIEPVLTRVYSVGQSRHADVKVGQL